MHLLQKLRSGPLLVAMKTLAIDCTDYENQSLLHAKSVAVYCRSEIVPQESSPNSCPQQFPTCNKAQSLWILNRATAVSISNPVPFLYYSAFSFLNKNTYRINPEDKGSIVGFSLPTRLNSAILRMAQGVDPIYHIYSTNKSLLSQRSSVA